MGERENCKRQKLDLESERHRLASQEQILNKQREEVAQRFLLVEGVEKQKLEVMRKQKEIDKQREELQLLDRRVRNSLGPCPSGPPVRVADFTQGTPPLPP